MIVCIAEKPSVARDIAEILGAKTRKDGYIEGNGYQVTWTFGHLCGLLEPHEYTPNWKAWALSHLPMIPQRFGIKVMNDSGIQKQFKVIETLMANADEVVNCGVAGYECYPPLYAEIWQKSSGSFYWPCANAYTCSYCKSPTGS